MPRTCLTIARLCSAMWVGAALLFVATSVTEQVQPSFDAATKNALALIRFPWFYGFEFALLGIGLVASLVVSRSDRTAVVAAALLGAALVAAAADYAFIYAPLRDLLATDTDRGPAFDRLHGWSERVNVIGFLLAAVAAGITAAASPDRRETNRSSRESKPVEG